ncbi:MAG: hypothetical protein ACLFPE_12095 [Bacteroidales bacterium]
MNFNEFKSSLSHDSPPHNLDRELEALWWDARGNWSKAHQSVHLMSNTSAAWVHAYLHRKEGDLTNASFWYASALRKMPEISLEEEWNEIVKKLLETEVQKLI